MSTTRSGFALACALRIARPLVAFLLRSGVSYPAFAAALKRVFLEAAEKELARTGAVRTDTAVSLLSGVHRKDVRALSQGLAAAVAADEPLNLPGLVVARWMGDARRRDARGRPKALPRTGFDELVQGISKDARPAAVLDELVRQGTVEVAGDQVRLLEYGFAPRKGFRQMAGLMSDSLHDHLAVAAANLEGRNDLEQAIYADGLTRDSVDYLHLVAGRAWTAAVQKVLQETQQRHEHDRDHAPRNARTHRMRFGAFYYGGMDDDIGE